MSKKRITFPLEVPSGSVTVKIYKVRNKSYRITTKRHKTKEKPRFSFMVSHFANGKRAMKMFADFKDAHAHAQSVGNCMSNGELDVLELRAADLHAYRHALVALQPTGVPLELAAKDYAEAWKIMGGKASLLEAAREYARRNLHAVPDMLLPAAVQEMLDAKEREKASQPYQKSLRFYLRQLAGAFNCQLRSVTTAQLGDFFRNMDVSARSKNNSRSLTGAFFKYCRARGWLPRDHEGISEIPKFKEKPHDVAIFTPWDMAQFLSFARPEFVPFIAIGAFAGLRSAEIGRLDWAEVHLADRFIEVKAAKAKTASRRLASIPDNLAQWLAPHVKEAGRVAPFDNIQRQLNFLVEETNAGLKVAAQAAGKDPAKARTVKWKKNALRHSFISYRVADVQDVPKVALEAGNSPAIIFRNYRELVRPADAKVWFSLAPGKDGKIIFFTPEKKTAKAETKAEIKVVAEQAEQKAGATAAG